MTLFTKGGRHAYLAHPPKTGGTSLTVMLRRAGWDTTWHVDHAAQIHPAHWTADRYQDELATAGIEPRIYLLVRHPIARLQSMYRRWETVATFDTWVRRVLDDGHVYASVRQVDYRPRRGASFRLLRFEHGVTTNLHRIDPAADVAPVKLESGATVDPARLALARQTHDAVVEHFRDDFFAFGYKP